MNIKFVTTHIKSGEKYFDDKDKEINYKEIVLPPNQKFILEINYPLSYKARFAFNSNIKGVTRHQLSEKIRKFYKKVYNNEDKYGIWGHDIGDLVLVDAFVSKKNIITLGVDS